VGKSAGVCGFERWWWSGEGRIDIPVFNRFSDWPDYGFNLL
jgi:hypothetical protein